MTFKNYIEEVRETFRNELAPFLAEKGLSPLKVLASTLMLERENLSIAIYPTGRKGPTIEQQAKTNRVKFAVMLYCNSDASEKSLVQAEVYYSSVLEFIQSRTFGSTSNLDESILCRMDEGEAVNGGIFLVSANIASQTDSGWDF